MPLASSYSCSSPIPQLSLHSQSSGAELCLLSNDLKMSKVRGGSHRGRISISTTCLRIRIPLFLPSFLPFCVFVGGILIFLLLFLRTNNWLGLLCFPLNELEYWWGGGEYRVKPLLGSNKLENKFVQNSPKQPNLTTPPGEMIDSQSFIHQQKPRV